jgi:hypothetical protein
MTYFVQVAPTGNISIADGKLNTSDTSLALPGRNTSNYGLSLNQNLVNLLQNFASLNSPAHAVLGQLWYDTNGNDLKVYNGSNWSSVTPAWDAYAGSHSIRIPYGIDYYYLTAIVSQNQIVAIYSERAFVPAELPEEVLISGSAVPYAVNLRFPQGLSQGVTMATQGGNLFVMTGVATQAQILQTARTIAIAGDISGSVLFDGSQDVVINGSLSNLNVAGIYNQVTVDNAGRVIRGNVNLGNADIITALGYTPLGSIVVTGDASASINLNDSVATLNIGLSNTAVIPGTYNSVTVNQQGRVVDAAVSLDLPQFGIIMWPQTYAVPNNFAICNGQTVTGANNLVIKTPDLRTFTIGTTTFIMRIS